jgi:hypothetical protein
MDDWWNVANIDALLEEELGGSQSMWAFSGVGND